MFASPIAAGCRSRVTSSGVESYLRHTAAFSTAVCARPKSRSGWDRPPKARFPASWTTTDATSTAVSQNTRDPFSVSHLFQSTITVDQVKAPLRFDGQWKRSVGHQFLNHSYTRIDFTLWLKQDPITARIEAVTLRLEKKGIKTPLNGKSPSSTKSPDKRYPGKEIERIAVVQIDVPVDGVADLATRDTREKYILQLPSLNDTDGANNDVSGCIGFERGLTYIKLQCGDTQLATMLTAPQTGMFRFLVSYAVQRYYTMPHTR